MRYQKAGNLKMDAVQPITRRYSAVYFSHSATMTVSSMGNRKDAPKDAPQSSVTQVWHDVNMAVDSQGFVILPKL